LGEENFKREDGTEGAGRAAPTHTNKREALSSNSIPQKKKKKKEKRG
jgi:hypothetical protein